MKKSSYDIPAYKFGIIKIDNRAGHKNDQMDYLKAIENNTALLIPFENVDGLEISEVINSLNIEEIFLMCYTFYQDINEKNYYHNVALYHFHTQLLYEDLSIPIDQLIESCFESDYIKKDDKEKRVFRCFFERYQDKSFELTKQRIKRLEQSNLSQE